MALSISHWNIDNIYAILGTAFQTWVVQVSAQRTEEEARSAFRVAQSKYAMLAGYQVLIRKKDRGRHGVFYAAQVGPLSPDEAHGLCSQIKNAGGKCFTQEN